MAGDWIKFETVTPDKPEVWMMAEILSLDPDEVIGKLIRLWIWADQQTINGDAPSVTRALLNRVTGDDGFATAMEQVGWLKMTDHGAIFPNFDRHNGKPAKTRALTKRRMEALRSASNICDDVSVTTASPEKRREEKSKTTRVKRFVPPTLEEVTLYCQEKGYTIDPSDYMDWYQGNGWVVGKAKAKMKDWKAAVRTWVRMQKTRDKENHDSSTPDPGSYI